MVKPRDEPGGQELARKFAQSVALFTNRGNLSEDDAMASLSRNVTSIRLRLRMSTALLSAIVLLTGACGLGAQEQVSQAPSVGVGAVPPAVSPFMMMSGNKLPPPAFTHRVAPATPLKELLPTPPKFKAFSGLLLTNDVSKVPEVVLAEPLAASTSANDVRVETFKQIAKIAHFNRNRIDGFVNAVASRRGDLSGLPFVTGDACRLDEERSKQFRAALDLIRQARIPEAAASAPAGQVHTSLDSVGDLDPEGDDAKWFWQKFPQVCATADEANNKGDHVLREHVILARIAALMQVLAPERAAMRGGLANYLAGVTHPEATRALARLAIFSSEEEVRAPALAALKVRREKDYTPLLLQGLGYPWPDVARHAGDAIVKLERTDLLPQLAGLLESPDPRAPLLREIKGKHVHVIRELVKIHHVRNCLLCHAPGNPPDPETGEFRSGLGIESSILTAPLPVPVEPSAFPRFGGGGYGWQQQELDLIVRFDVTFLRQDFSRMLPVAASGVDPELQRFDFLVRTRVLSEKEAAVYREKLAKRGLGAVTPYERAILAALRELTGRDTEPTAAAWRTLLAAAPRE